MGTGQIANSIHCALIFFLMVNCLYMVFSFTYEPKDFYVVNALLWTKQTKKKKKSYLLKLILARKVSVSCKLFVSILSTRKFAVAIALAVQR